MLIHSIELTNFCNLACGYCPNGRDVAYPHGFISLDHYIKGLEYAIDGVGLSVCGESTLHPDLFSFIKIARKYGKLPGLNTNGLNLTPDYCRRLVDSGLTKIEVSIHNEECYKKYKMFCELKLPITITSNVMSSLKDDAVKWRGSDDLPLRINYQHNWAQDDPHPTMTCKFMAEWDYCCMKWDGVIVACCFDFDGKAVLGHVDNYKELKHKPSYELCKTCSPSWATYADRNFCVWI